MAMCKECKSVVGADEIENGICKKCIDKGVVAEIKEEVSTPGQNVKRSDFSNPFSFTGKSGRLDYLVYGVGLTYILIFGGIILGSQLGNPVFLIGMILLGVWVGLAATVRRSRDREVNIFLIILLSLIPYVGFVVTLYLLFAPGKQVEVKNVSIEENSEQLLAKEMVNEKV
jgi:uncharacterized membrane protein YhaH (DUF805 family)